MRSKLFNILFVSGTAVVAATAYIGCFFLPAKIISKWLYVWGHFGQWLVKTMLAGNIEIRGIENLPTDQTDIIAAKHQSELDILVTVSMFPDLTTAAMKTLEKTPFFGRIIRKLGFIVVDLAIPQNRTQQMIEGARKAFANNRPIVIYPEGTLMALGAKERYRGGIWHIYNDLNVKVTPVAMSLGVIWPRRDKIKYKGKTGVYEFLPPIAPGLDKDTFMALLEETIETNTMRLIEENATGDVLIAAQDRYARGVGNEDIPWQAAQDIQRRNLTKD
jgi:1-acyl-sn-glycerol-3-phosphate acyltransferase